nr:hypothetical protein [Tanacetum cinerariifolium]
MVDWLNIVETDKVIHIVEIDIVKLVVEVKSFGMCFDEFDKETGSSDGLQPKQADLSCVHALNEVRLHEIRVVPKSLYLMCEMMTHWSEKPLRHWNERDEGQWHLEGSMEATEASEGKMKGIEILWEHRFNGHRHANSE